MQRKELYAITPQNVKHTINKNLHHAFSLMLLFSTFTFSKKVRIMFNKSSYHFEVLYMKKLISIVLIFSILSTQAAVPQKAYAWWWSSEPQPFNKDLRFETLYPVPFWSSTTGQGIKYTSIAVVVGVITYFTVGTAAITAVSALAAEATPGAGSLIWIILTGTWVDVAAWSQAISPCSPS